MWKWNELKRLLLRKSETSNFGAVMWPVLYPDMGKPEYNPKNPHITIVMFRDITDPGLGFTKEDLIDAVRETMWDTFIYVEVEKLEWFGVDSDIPVLSVRHSYLPEYHRQIRAALSKKGIEWDKTFPVYKPHISITDEAALDKVYPRKLMAGPVEVWWGDEHFEIEPPL